MKLQCMECGKVIKFTGEMLPECPRCGGSDIDIAEG
jgi:Zn finger protein HypA/HybF involved in hydrogenase expression